MNIIADFLMYGDLFSVKLHGKSVRKGTVDEKAMIRKRYHLIQHPSPDTIRERNTNNLDGIK